MDSYIVEITNPRVKKTIAELGIDENLLIVKKLEDFYEAGVPDEVASLRFDYYKRKQQDLSKLINKKLKESVKHNKIPNFNQNQAFITEQRDSVYRIGTNDLEKVKNFEKKKILKNFQDYEKQNSDALEIDKKIEQCREEKQRVLSLQASRTARKTESDKLKQIANLKNLDKKIKTANKKNKFYDNSNYSFTPTVRRDNSFIFKPRESFAESDDNLEEKIRSIDDRLKKSEKKHKLHIESKKQAVSKMLLRFEVKKTESDENEKIINLISKQKNFKERYENIIAAQIANRFRIKSLQEKKISQARQKAKLNEIQSFKSDSINSRFAKSELVLKKKQEEHAKKLEIKSEIHRLKEMNISNEMKRVSNMM